MGYCLWVGATQNAAHLNVSVNLFFQEEYIYVSVETAAIGGWTRSCLRKDRLGQLGSERCESRPSHRNKWSQRNFIPQEIRDVNCVLKCCYTIMPLEFSAHQLPPDNLGLTCSLLFFKCRVFVVRERERERGSGTGREKEREGES